MAKTLELNFSTANGKNVNTGYCDEPRADLTAPAVEAAMQAVIASGVFEMDGFPLDTSKGARIVERNVTEIVEAKRNGRFPSSRTGDRFY